MGNERFSVPEIIFRPDDIGGCSPPFPLFFLIKLTRYQGLEQSGLPSTIAASIALLPDDLQGMFWANIGLIGGTTSLPGFRQRL
jgi:actin-related protein 6